MPVDNPLNAVGGNEDDYSTMVLGTALLGGIQQTLIFPDLRADTRLVVESEQIISLIRTVIKRGNS
jgi:hypothetical protein